jgi:hypothetical protein
VLGSDAPVRHRTWETSIEGYLRRSRDVAALRRVEPEADDPGVLSDDRRSGVDPGGCCAVGNVDTAA